MELQIFPGETDQEKQMRLHEERINRAKMWRETGEKINLVKIKEASLEEHFEANWDKYNENFHNTNLSWWKAYRDRQELTIVEARDQSKTYVVDEDNLAIVNPEDTVYFYRLGPCWAVLIDTETENEGLLRVAFHQGGIVNVFRDIRDLDIQSLVDLLQRDGKVLQISILYNSSIQQDKDIEATKKALSSEIPLFVHDLGNAFGGGPKDLFVKGNTVEVYQNKASKRVYSGEVSVFEPKI